MKNYLLLYSLLFVLVIAGCSGGSGGQTIDIYGIDQLRYVVAEQQNWLQTGQEVSVNGETYYELEGMTVNAGDELTVNLHTISQLPPSGMSHNWLLLKLDASPQAFNDSSATARENDYVSPSMEDQVITDTGLVPGGETKSTSLTVPDETGEYNYLCTFPGHFTSGMRGTLTVE